jgi:hypothetical protein
VTGSRAAAVVAALGLAFAAGACSSGDDAPAPEPPVTLSTKLSQPVRLDGSYLLDGRRRRVDAQIAFDHLTDPYRAAMSAPSPGTRLVAVQLQVLNRGRDPFPLEWARLRGYDERGRALPSGTQSTPVRKTVPDRPVRGQVLTSFTAFRVPRGARLASIRMSSIVRLWRFNARWELTP